MIIGADCSTATEPVAELAPFWNLVQVSKYNVTHNACSLKILLCSLKALFMHLFSIVIVVVVFVVAAANFKFDCALHVYWISSIIQYFSMKAM